MKTILIAVLLLLNLFCWGQQQKTAGSEFSLLDPTNLWSVLDNFTTVHVHPSDPYSYVKSTWYKIGNYATINGYEYKQLMKSTDPTHVSWSVSGYLRQDGNRIYLLQGDREILLYDFGLAVGGTIELAINAGFNYISRLDSIRDITIQNSVRKIYYLTEYPASYPGTKNREVWIEGIGSISNGLLRQTMFGLTGESYHDYQLLCFHQNVTLIYQSKDYKNCYYDIVDGISDLSSAPEDFQIFPNPGSGKFTLKLKGDQSVFHVEIINVAGLVIKEFNSNYNSPLIIDLSEQKKGIYFLRLRTENGLITKKIILD